MKRRRQRYGYSRGSDFDVVPILIGGGVIIGGALLLNSTAGAVLGTKIVVGNDGPILAKSVGNGQFMASDAADAFNAMAAAAYNSDGPWGQVVLLAGSAFRDIAQQGVLYAQYLARAMLPPVVAKPGTSNHGAGIAVDIADGSGRSITQGSPEFLWLSANAPFYGFSWSEGQAVNEPWHWDFVG